MGSRRPGGDRRRRVAIIGTGGTGSHVVTQLAHLGVRTLLLVDPDVVETTNLPRLIGATSGDVGGLKADVLAAAARAINPLVEIRVIPDSVLDTDPALLADMDVVLRLHRRSRFPGAAHRARAAVLRPGDRPRRGDRPLARRDAGRRRRADPAPGTGVPALRRTLDPALIREEYLDPGEREAERDAGTCAAPPSRCCPSWP